MASSQKRTYCTDATWLGRSDCKHCSIRNVMLFSGLPDTAFDGRLGRIDHFIFPPGSVLYQEGRNDAAIFSIRGGIVKLLSHTPDGDQRIVRLLGTSAAIGLEMLEPDCCYKHTAIAVNEVDACRIPTRTVHTLEGMFPEIYQQVRNRLLAQLERADQWITLLGTGPARKRIAHLLLMMVEYSSSDDDGIALLAGSDMAAIIGASPETVSRILADLKRNAVLQKISGNRYRCDEHILASISRDN